MLPRHVLPQIPKEQYGKFVTFLKDNGIRCSLGLINVEKLQPIQSHVNREKIEHFKNNPDTLKLPVFISKGGFILDGHHRFLATQELGKTKLPCIVANCSIKDLVEKGHEFEGSFTKTVYEWTDKGRKLLENCEQDEEEPIALLVRKTLKPSYRG